MKSILNYLLFFFLTGQCVTDFPFRNVSLPIEERLDDLLGRLTVAEILDQMSHGGGGGDGSPVPAIPELGIGTYSWGTECIHGDQSGNATSFPLSIGLAATFNPELMKEVASAISTEVRAKNNDFVRRGIFSGHTGLNCFSPVINIMRHPLWGRNQETYGEDPFLTGVLAAEFVKGLIGNHSRYYRANAVCKHFDAYGGPEDLPQSRLSFNAKVPEQDLYMTYLPQFKQCVQSGALGVMCSYNSVNGIPACANKMLLTDILRKKWNFPGFVISDSGAVEFLIVNHRYIENIEDAAVACVKAGLNLELHPGSYARGAFDWLKYAIADGKLSKDLILERVRPLFLTRMKLGEFDPPHLNPYNDLDLSVIQSVPHRQLSTLSAMQSFVLLKNDGILPIKKIYQKVAIVGPFADNPVQQMGDYGPDVDLKYTSTVSSGLLGLGDKLVNVSGCKDTWCVDYDSKAVITAVQDADLVVLCLGTGPAVERENFDRRNMLLPGHQPQLMKDVTLYARGRIILLLFSAGPLDIRSAQQPVISAIIQCFFPAQATGVALYHVLTFSQPEANPAGRLPFTWYTSDHQVPSMTDYSMKNRTYRYFNDDPLYPFGYGLSYTQFMYSDLELSPTKVKPGENVTVRFVLTNVGDEAGEEVTQVYISWLNATVVTPRYQLVHFNRTMFYKGWTVNARIDILSEQMAVYVPEKGFVIEPGDIRVYVGGQLPNQKTKVPSNVIQGIFTIV
ncbi:uncharacterized protein LOC132750886 [Ruditapes philippinarum]|uniref:uncharacterized protein LOC132750886 n=1 Tax=Ruditapes philippinarum TaxID=129788 RepID=UPI00295AF07E|nr:uncharacterized protein LOC132750886 [Ruditapes philippinarum]